MLVMKPAGSWTISPFSQSRRATGNAVTSPVNLYPLSDSTACTPFEWFSVAVGGLLPEAVAFLYRRETPYASERACTLHASLSHQ